MTLEEDKEDASGGDGGVYPCRFYDKARAGILDPRERHMDRPNAAPDNFARAHDLDG